MSRWWAAVPRSISRPGDTLSVVLEQAASEGAVLRSQEPVAGWMAVHRRDGKWYPHVTHERQSC